MNEIVHRLYVYIQSYSFDFWDISCEIIFN